MRISVLALIAIIAFANPLFAAEHSPEPLFVSTESGQQVPSAALDAALSGSSVIGRLAPGDTAHFLGVAVESGSDSMVLLGASSDLV